MEKHIVKVLATAFVTHNVKRFVVEKPAGYTYAPGQATDVALNSPDLINELRPFTFTSPQDADHLEFIIKIYKGHNGVTEQLAKVEAGDELVIHDVFGAIAYKGPGVFIAGGAGITPFIAIFRQLKASGQLAGNTLLLANHTIADIILQDELKSLLGEHYIDIIRTPPFGNAKRLIDKELLDACILEDTTHYYICGPETFTSDMIGMLHDLNVGDEQIVIEQ
ncbi:flavodoxin reductase [Mucilaginibacter sp. 14171R-50]|uniref:FAD-binding oxidoreductase n=1 Tax=Mucilaginibacter sp. 14171R-50 TaxID=2703789 RepID=UPI00138BEFF4|nr:FAD-binding oxidoreductase [Mucilaginibacter sp. 14171R-50]QHS56604.1 flavodoxin reductase [Mucilaginibacter sp. 14171R-50]